MNIDIRENYIKDIHDENDNVFISKALKSEESFNDTGVNSISSNGISILYIKYFNTSIIFSYLLSPFSSI